MTWRKQTHKYTDKPQNAVVWKEGWSKKQRVAEGKNTFSITAHSKGSFTQTTARLRQTVGEKKMTVLKSPGVLSPKIIQRIHVAEDAAPSPRKR